MNGGKTKATIAAVAVAYAVMGATPAWAAKSNHGGGQGHGGGSTGPAGIDVSYPQCPATSLPSGEAFAIVGVNGGLANDYNSCVGTEFHYATTSTGTTKQAKAQLYLNTADPGNGVADWPSPSQPGAIGTASTPYGTCDYANGTSGAGANSPACAYAYGYDMVAGILYGSGDIKGDLADFNTATGQSLYQFPVWLDVETANSWLSGSTGQSMNVADLQGMTAALDQAASNAGTPAPVLGVYSTSSQWAQITGTPTGTAAGSLSGLPDWIPGATTQSGATSNCSLPSFTSGTVVLTQWVGRTYDGDYSCIG